MLSLKELFNILDKNIDRIEINGYDMICYISNYEKRIVHTISINLDNGIYLRSDYE